MKELKEYSVVELESLAYKQIVQMEQSQNNLKIINQEIASRSKEAPQPEEAKEE